MKISDFGTSREWNEISTKMSFAGTVAWMAPEVIRNEPCSEKVDIWSFGVVLWELLTCEVPYKDVDSSAIIWGVGNNSLHLPVPNTCPDGFKLLIKCCWSVKPRNRPSFKIILHHLEIAGTELLEQSSWTDEEYFEQQKRWREQVRDHMLTVASNSSNIHKYEQDLIKKREDEWKHAQEVRQIYENRLAMTNKLFLELKQREREITEREKHLPPGYKRQYKKICNPLKATSPRLKKSASVQAEAPALYAQVVDTGGTQATKSVIVAPKKKLRHRRAGSGNFSPKSSPSHDRKTHSEPSGSKKLVSTETQTDAMDMSETESPAATLPRRMVTMCLREDAETHKTTIAYIKSHDEDQPPPLSDPLSSPINGNDMTNSGVSIFRDTCSSPDLLNDVMNSNERLELRISDGDNLERLERKVSQFITANDNGNGGGGDETKYHHPNPKKRSYVSVTDSPDIVLNGSSKSSFATSRAGSQRRESHHHGVVADEKCNDSWTDEEEGDERDDYNYSLRRKR